MSGPEDDDEEGLDFIFDGSVRSPHTVVETRPKVEQLRQAIETYRSGLGSIRGVETVLGILLRNITEVIQECDMVLQEHPSQSSVFDERQAYQNASEAILRMQAACAEERMDWLQQGLASLEAAVSDINALVALEREE